MTSVLNDKSFYLLVSMQTQSNFINGVDISGWNVKFVVNNINEVVFFLKYIQKMKFEKKKIVLIYFLTGAFRQIHNTCTIGTRGR